MTILGWALVVAITIGHAIAIRRSLLNWLSARDARIRAEEREWAALHAVLSRSEIRLEMLRELFPDTFGDVATWDEVKKRVIAIRFAEKYSDESVPRGQA